MNNAYDLDASGLQVDDRQNEIAHEPMERQNLDAEEVRVELCKQIRGRASSSR